MSVKSWFKYQKDRRNFNKYLQPYLNTEYLKDLPFIELDALKMAMTSKDAYTAVAGVKGGGSVAIVCREIPYSENTFEGRIILFGAARKNYDNGSLPTLLQRVKVNVAKVPMFGGGKRNSEETLQDIVDRVKNDLGHVPENEMVQRMHAPTKEQKREDK